MALTPVVINAAQGNLKHGDIFTVNPDSEGAEEFLKLPKEYVRDRKFIAVPANYQSRSLRKIWQRKIENAEIKLIESKRRVPMHNSTILLTEDEIAWADAGKIEAAEKKRARKAAKYLRVANGE